MQERFHHRRLRQQNCLNSKIGGTLAKQKWNLYLVLTASPDTGIINDKKVQSYDFSLTITTVINAPIKIAPEVI
jgi:hypothetical protein